MPWSEISIMSQRIEFVHRVLERRQTVAELCTEFQISEKTGYKWMARFRHFGAPGLADRSHAPHHIPHRMPDAIAKELVEIRRAHPTWGPRKLALGLESMNLRVDLPRKQLVPAGPVPVAGLRAA